MRDDRGKAVSPGKRLLRRLPARTRRKLLFVGRGLGAAPPARLLDLFGPESLPPELGGTAAPLGGDAFLRRAVESCGARARSEGPCVAGPAVGE